MYTKNCKFCLLKSTCDKFDHFLRPKQPIQILKSSRLLPPSLLNINFQRSDLNYKTILNIRSIGHRSTIMITWHAI